MKKYFKNFFEYATDLHIQDLYFYLSLKKGGESCE